MSGIVRDFSKNTQEAIMDLLEDNYDNNHKHIIDGLENVKNVNTDYHFIEINNKYNTNKIKEYYSKIIEANILSQKEYERLIEKVYDVDQNYCGKASIVYKQIHEYAVVINFLNNAFLKNENGQYEIELDTFITHTLYIMSMYVDSYNKRSEYGLNPAFDQYGMYGGNQSEADWYFEVGSDEFNQVAAIARKYDKYSEYSDKEIEDFLELAGNTGCAYIAMINTIFDRYVGREDEFEKTFGYPMYMKGDLNYSSIFIDFYSYVGFEGGISREDRAEKWESFCSEHNIDVKVESISEMNKEIFDSYKYGDIHINIQACKFNLLDEEGNIICENEGYHAMSVTGITDDGRVIVSSWGDCYYFDPKTSGVDIAYQIIDYN